MLGLDPAEVQRPDFASYLSGNQILPGATPAAHCYCGHQFGHFSGQLGDGVSERAAPLDLARALAGALGLIPDRRHC